jgi:hypothetical protein
MQHSASHSRSTRPTRPPAGRRGAATLWTILAIPAVLTLLGVLTEVANLYLARIELTNAMESAALAAVKHWGDAGGGDTWIPRTVGNQFSFANTVNGAPVDLSVIDPTLNYNPASPCNQNNCSEGVLVFGAIVDDDPEFVFDCCETPSCGVGTIWLDVTGNSTLGGPSGGGPNSPSQDNHWGISFQPNVFPIPPGVTTRIRRVVYELPQECDIQNQTVEPRFDFSSVTPKVSVALTDDDSNVLLQDNCPVGQAGRSAQADVHGIDWTQVQFYIEVDDPCAVGNGTLVTAPTATSSRTLAVEFPDSPGAPNGFDLMDRLRFGARVRDAAGGGPGSQLDADEIGHCMTQVTVCFNDGTSCTVTFVDTDEPGNTCLQCVDVAPWGINVQPPPNSATNRGLIIHPLGVPDIPCAAGSGNNNNGQSLAMLGTGLCAVGGSGRAFAVRAHTTFQVPSIVCELFCIPIGPFNVTACADALYDCQTRRPRLYHLEERNFLCDRPCP